MNIDIEAITPEKLYLILPGKVTLLAMIFQQKFGVSIKDAIRMVYRSNTYKDLEIEETKLWHYGPVALFEYYQQHH